MTTEKTRSPERAATTANAVIYLCVVKSRAGQRLDNFLLARYRHVPKSHIYRIIRSGEVRVNRGRVQPSHRIRENDRIRIPPMETVTRRPPQINPGDNAIERRILFEDESLLLVDKPAGLAAHAGTGNSYGLVDLLRRVRPDDDINLAHRLDRQTSGCLAAAKTRDALLALQRAFRRGDVDKTYLALVVGRWKPPARVEVALSRAPHVQKVTASGKPALSYFSTRQRFKRHTLVSVRIATGRTHQIRVHAAHCKHPVAGDRKYGDHAANRELEKLGMRRMFLHARRLSLEWGGRTRNFQSPLPEDLQELLRQLEGA